MRARTPTNPVRPEVIDALDELERSLGDVARWEQLLTGKEPGPDWQRPTEPTTPRPKHLGPEHLAGSVDDGDVGMDAVANDLQDAIRELDDRIDEIRPDPRPVTFDDPAAGVPAVAAGYELGQIPDRVPPVVAPVEVSPLLLQARTVDPGRSRRTVSVDELEEVTKRRRNGRMLTATGLALLAGLGALFLLPDNDDDTPLEQPEVVTTVSVPVSTTELLPVLPTFPSEEVTTVPTAVPDTTATTKKATTPTTRKPATAPVTTQPPTASTLPTPGAPTTQPPPTTTTTLPPTTTTTEQGVDPPPT